MSVNSANKLDRADDGEADRETYSIFARFRRNRLALMRRVSLDDALRFVAKVRSERFHDPGGVFVICDRTGELVDEGDAEAAGEATSSGPAIVVVEPQGARDARGDGASATEARRYLAPSGLELHARAHKCLETTGRTMAQLHASVTQLQRLLNEIQGSAGEMRRRH